MNIRPAADADWPLIYPFFASIVSEGTALPYPESLSSEQARPLWMGQGRIVVAVEGDAVLGTAAMGANRSGRGAHIATASFMVDPEHQGRGVGRALGLHVIEWATAQEFRGIQFNAVVETNQTAVRLWQSLGFQIIGTVPQSFDHPDHGFVGLHVMYRSLVDS